MEGEGLQGEDHTVADEDHTVVRVKEGDQGNPGEVAKDEDQESLDVRVKEGEGLQGEDHTVVRVKEGDQENLPVRVEGEGQAAREDDLDVRSVHQDVYQRLF